MKASELEVVQIDVDRLLPNPWNVNRMPAGLQAKLAAYLKREGFVEPLVVRPHPEQQGAYEIIGGEHRWRVAKERLGYSVVPCVVLKGLDDKRAKILSVNLNSMKGEAVPSLLSKLLNDLQQGVPLDDLAATLPYDTSEITDFLSLLQVPQGFADELEAEAQAQDEEAPMVLTLVLDRKQAALWEKAVELASNDVAGARNPKARTLELMANEFIAPRRKENDGRKQRSSQGGT
jgi:ParB/RepB/Spo0J family partition protein